MSARNTSPVFVVGSPRSGTTLLYSMLESAGGFPVYGHETTIFDHLAPCFGNLHSREQVARALAVWEKSDQCTIAGLDMGPVRRQILEECRNPGDFLRIFMESVARKQGVARWAEQSPTHLLFMREIKRTIPNALFVHIVRDGRDVALSLDKLGWVVQSRLDPLPGVLVGGIFWRWAVSRGTKIGREIGPDYLEVHYEDLLSHPQQTLDTIGAFIGQSLNYDQILLTGAGAVRRPNTSFGPDLNFVGRWRKHLTPERLAQLEHLIGPLLEEKGYERSAPAAAGGRPIAALRILYEARMAAGWWAKMHGLARRRVTLERFQPGCRSGRNFRPPPEAERHDSAT